MAETPHKSKSSNTFRFKSFADRVAEIDIRRLALYHIGHQNEELLEDSETYFHQTLKKWMVLNLSDEFSAFSRKCLKIVTLPQLVHQKDFLIDLLLEHLTTATTLSLQPTLELLHVLARDLREEFYVYFQRVLDRLICLLNTQDADQLEWTLVCLAHLFKTLKPHLKRNIGVIFHSILPLLDEQRYEEHVTNFAVECFSFIARDVRDFKKFLDFVLQTVQREQVESVQGCGRLFFEILRGTQQRFHSMAEEFLHFLFGALVDDQRKSTEDLELLSLIVSETLKNVLHFIAPENIGLLWKSLCFIANEVKDTTKLLKLLPLFIQTAQCRSGRYITELDTVISTILAVIKRCDENNNEEGLELLGVLVSKLLLASNRLEKGEPLVGYRLIQPMLALQNRLQIEKFILLITDYLEFDILVLPTVLQIFETYFDLQSFELMSRIVLRKQPLAINGSGLQKWKRYELAVKKEEIKKKLNSKLKHIEFNTEKKEENLLLLLLVPHFKVIDLVSLQQILVKVTADTLNLLQRTTHPSLQELITILALLIETQIHLNFEISASRQRQLVKALLPLSNDLRAIGCLDQILTTTRLHKQLDCVLIIDSLAPLLSSQSHEVRLTVAHALSQLPPANAKSPANPYKIFYEAENIEPNLHNYREQLLLVQKLETTGSLFKSFKDDERLKKNSLQFLLGMLYHNFKFVWEPVLKLIEGYAVVMPTQDFWEVYKAKMVEINDSIEDLCQSGIKSVAEIDLWRNHTLNDLLKSPTVSELTQKELLNYRSLLWLRLPHYGQLSEIKNRELVAMFLKFVQDEYRKNLLNREYTWNLKEEKVLTEADEEEYASDDENVRDVDDMEECVTVTDKRQHKKRERKRSSKEHKRNTKNQASTLANSILQSLETMMGVFVRQANPKALFRESELHALWLELLAGPNAQLQKLALDCLLTYKTKAHIHYREHLHSLIDEKKFKDELTSFKLNEVSEEHRVELMPLLLRILYGKMIAKGTQRSMSSQVRKGLILRFLGQCSAKEIQCFLHMAFDRYEQYTNDTVSLDQIPDLVRNHFDLSSVWSPKKLQNIVNLLELIRKEFGGLMDVQFHLYMLKLLTFVGSVCNAVLLHANTVAASQMHPKMPAVFKNVKNAALLSLVNFFAHIEDFLWQDTQIACLTLVFVWPGIERLAQDSIHSPTALLKLLLQWGEKPQHFKFLNQKHPTTGNVVFHYVIELMLNEKAKATVRKPIMALIERLLIASIDSPSSDSLALIQPFVSHILSRLKTSFSTRSAKQSLDKRDLNILALLTSHVEDAETCNCLLQLLLPVLIAKTQTQATEDVICQVIKTVVNLIKRSDAAETYLLKVAPLFGEVQEVQARKLLCQLISDIAKQQLKEQRLTEQHCARLKQTARLMLMLNAWDKRWVEQPDYEKRLDALKEVTQMLGENGVDLDLGVLVIYNCFYFIKYDKDLGLRDNASEHLQILIPQLVQRYAEDRKLLDYLVGDVLINLLRRVTRDNNDNVRHEGIRLLGVMARECAHAHEILADLAPLADRHDVEVDFFENITHLQSHRHGRALLRFCTTAESLRKTPNVRTLTQFILPLATRYLLSDKYSSKHTLIDAAIEALGVACQLLPWQQYHAVLRYYLMKMRASHDNQKQSVRIVVRILDAFHFDLSQSRADEQALQKLRDELKEKVAPGIEAKKEEVSSVKVRTATEDEDDVAAPTVAKTEEEDLENALDKASEEINSKEEDEQSVAIAQESEPIIKRPLLLTPSASRRVITTIATVLIPTLNRSITERSSYDTKHKLNRKRFSFEREEEEILRVPIALALVKLMQKLPKELLDTSLPGVFMKVCTFLRSPLKSVRMLTRDILKKIMLALGANYLPLLMDHLQNLLTRGFQVHVLAVTVHGVLEALREQLQPDDLERCLRNLLEVALNDIFGEISAEKEVEKIAAHTPEAKPSAKSYLVLHIAARNIREHSLLDLLMPFKDHLARSHSRKLVMKIQDCFAKIVSGLVVNPHISRESLLIFIYGTVSESIVDLLPGTQKRELSEQEKEKMRRARSDCYIIPPAPQRARPGLNNKTVRTNAQANAHILIEFGLEMLHIVLKRMKLMDITYQPFLNPILPLLREALRSTHIRVTTFALKCFATMLNDEYDCPALQDELNAVVERLFEILKNFSTFGARRQEENQQLVRSAYKTIVALLRKCVTYTLTAEQLDQLILLVEHDLYEGDNQALSFSLLKAMLARRVDVPPIHDIMKRMSDLSIVSSSDFVRDEARGMLITYVMEYTLKRRVDQILKYFTVQLCYTLPAGRQSAIKFLHLVVQKFPLNILAKRAEFLYLSLGTRLVNDEDSDCRKSVAECIELLITRLERENRQRLFDMTLLFFSDPAGKPSVREMAAALCSRFLNVEQKAFAPRIKLVLPTLVGCLTLSNPNTPGRFVRLASGAIGSDVNVADIKLQAKRKKLGESKIPASVEEVARKQRAIDHELIQIQYTLLKIFEYCSMDLFANQELSSIVDELAYESQRLLGHEHTWVRCNAAKVLALILSSYDFDAVGNKLRGLEVKQNSYGPSKLDFIYLNPEYDIKSLVLDLCAQLMPGDTLQQLIDEIVKIFLYIASMLRNVPFTTKHELEQQQEKVMNSADPLPKINLYWLVRKIRFLVNKEVAKAPHCISMRTALFTFIEGFITLLDVDTLERLAAALLAPLVREMSEADQNVDPELRQLALRVGSKLRKRIGSDLYDKLRSSVQTQLMMRRAERKKLIAQEKIHDPVKAAKRKIGVQERKKTSKKLKTALLRGKAADVKQKLKKRKRKAEEDLF